MDAMPETEAIESNWWSRKCGGRDVMAIALPLIVSTTSFTVMQFCDRVFLTWYAILDLGAVVPAGALSWTCVSLALGIAMYANTFVAQYDGAKSPGEIGSIVWQAIWIGIICIPLFIALAQLSFWFFTSSGHSPRLVWRETAYFHALSFGSGVIVINAALESFYTGRGKTVVVMVVNLIAAAINILLDYFMIFGFRISDSIVLYPGGITGAGWATSIAIWIKLGILLLLFLRAENRHQFNTLAWQVHVSKSLRLLRYGLPNGLQFVIEGGAITVFILIIARISELASASTALAFSVNMIVFVPVIGIGIAVTTLVGQQIGERNPDLAARATWTSLVIALGYTAFFAVAYLMAPEVFLMAHNTHTEDFEQVKDLAVILLMFVAMYCVFDTVQIIFVSAIKGAGDTLFVVVTTVVSSLMFLIAGFQGSSFFQTDNGQLMWWWGCLTGWILILCGAYFGRFQQGKWRSMSVIESEFLSEVENEPQEMASENWSAYSEASN